MCCQMNRSINLVGALFFPNIFHSATLFTISKDFVTSTDTEKLAAQYFSPESAFAEKIIPIAPLPDLKPL